MKQGIHPQYKPTVFIDGEHQIRTRSTLSSQETTVIDGVEHQVVHVDISSYTHPFYTGRQRILDTAGRVEKFRRSRSGLSASAADFEASGCCCSRVDRNLCSTTPSRARLSAVNTTGSAHPNRVEGVPDRSVVAARASSRCRICWVDMP